MLLAVLFVLAFFAAGLSDYLETKYVLAVHSNAPRKAALCSVGMWAIGALGLLAIIEVSPWIVLPEGLGMYLGTVLAMRRP